MRPSRGRALPAGACSNPRLQAPLQATEILEGAWPGCQLEPPLQVGPAGRAGLPGPQGQARRGSPPPRHGFRNWATHVTACPWSNARLRALTWLCRGDAGSWLAVRPVSSVRPDCLTVGVGHVQGLWAAASEGHRRGVGWPTLQALCWSHTHRPCPKDTYRRVFHRDFRGKLVLSVPMGHSVWSKRAPVYLFVSDRVTAS